MFFFSFFSFFHLTFDVIQENNRELHFSMVDGDFKKFEGKWSVKSQKGYDTVLFFFVITKIVLLNLFFWFL